MAPLTTSRLDVPQRSDLLPVEDVEAVIQAADRELTALEREAAEATAAADAMQQRVVDEGADERSSSWAMMQLRRFLDGLSEEVDREVAALVDVAERWAKQRVAEAHAEAEAVRAYERSAANPEPDEIVHRDADQSAREGSPIAMMGSRIAPPEAAVAPEPVSEPVPVPVVPVAVEPTFVPVVPELADPPVSTGVHDVAPTADEAKPLPSFFQPDESAVAPPVESATGAPVSTPPPVAAVETDATSPISMSDDKDEQTSASDPRPGSGDAFWSDPEPKKKPRRFRRIPWTAVLQVLAVLAILVFILLRLS